MKALLYTGILLVIVILACGCTAPASAPATGTADQNTPDITGNWTGTMTGYAEGKGFTDYAGYVMTMQVTEQEGRIFHGNFTFSNGNGLVKTVEFSGATGRDRTTLTIAERGGGYSFGTLIAPDEIELIHADDAEPSDVAIDTLKKS
jgi:hypothetical protein